MTPAGNEIFVRRQYFKLVNHPTLLKGYVSERVPLNDGETVKSGERVETVITIEAKNNYEYLLFEDLKPAGLEAVQIRSGENLYVKELKSGALKSKDSTLDEFHTAVALISPAASVGLPGTARSQSCAVHRSSSGRRLADQLRNARRESRARSMRSRCWATRCTFPKFARTAREVQNQGCRVIAPTIGRATNRQDLHNLQDSLRGSARTPFHLVEYVSPVQPNSKFPSPSALCLRSILLLGSNEINFCVLAKLPCEVHTVFVRIGYRPKQD